MNKKWLIAGGITAALAVGLIAGSEAACSLASRRKSKLFELAQKKPKDILGLREDMSQALADNIEALRNQPMEIVSIRSHDGLSLVGHWYPAENPKRIVLMAHGWRSLWYRDFAMSAKFMHDSDCSLLYIEQRSHGESEGDYISYGAMERHDIQSWVDFILTRNPDDLPIYLCGISMGASTVLMATELPLKNHIKGVIADCGFTSGDAILKDIISKNMRHAPISAVFKITDSTYKHHTGIAYGDCSTIPAMRKCTVPVLFIHGGRDDFVPAYMTYENYEACAAPKDLFIVPDAAHGTSYLFDKEGYENKVLSFFDKYDK